MTPVRRACVLLAALTLAPSLVDAQPIKLRVTLQAPVTSHIGANLEQFKGEVEKGTENAISIEIFDRGQLYIDERVIDAVSSGEIEMGVAALDQFSYRTATVDVIQLPFLFNFGALVRAATQPKSELRMLIDNAVLDATKVRVLWWQPYGSAVFFSRGREAVVPSRIYNKKIGVFSETMTEFTRHCGGAPLMIPAAKMHDGLKDGMLDMVMAGVMSVDAHRLWTVADTITRTEHAALEFVVIINEQTWQSLAPQHRTIITEAARKAERALREQIAIMEGRAYVFARDKGMAIYELTPDQVAEWRACSAGVLDAYMKNPGDLIPEVAEAYKKLRTDPCCSSGPPGSFQGR